MKKNNIRNLVFWGLMALMLIAGIVLYMSETTANAVEENVVETKETGVTRWNCGDYADAYMQARRYADKIHTEHVWNERKLIGIDYDDYLQAYMVTYEDVPASTQYTRYFYEE